MELVQDLEAVRADDGTIRYPNGATQYPTGAMTTSERKLRFPDGIAKASLWKLPKACCPLPESNSENAENIESVEKEDVSEVRSLENSRSQAKEPEGVCKSFKRPEREKDEGVRVDLVVKCWYAILIHHLNYIVNAQVSVY